MIQYQYIKAPKLKNTNKITFWLNKSIKEEGKETGDIVYVFCSDEYVHKKNVEFLGKNMLTDVIAFDYCKDKIIHGDILISTERVKENAKTYNANYLNELYRVMIHGLLHLMGYNDKTKKELKIMREKENYYLTKFIGC